MNYGALNQGKKLVGNYSLQNSLKLQIFFRPARCSFIIYVPLDVCYFLTQFACDFSLRRMSALTTTLMLKLTCHFNFGERPRIPKGQTREGVAAFEVLFKYDILLASAKLIWRREHSSGKPLAFSPPHFPPVKTLTTTNEKGNIM